MERVLMVTKCRNMGNQVDHPQWSPTSASVNRWEKLDCTILFLRRLFLLQGRFLRDWILTDRGRDLGRNRSSLLPLPTSLTLKKPCRLISRRRTICSALLIVVFVPRVIVYLHLHLPHRSRHMLTISCINFSVLGNILACISVSTSELFSKPLENNTRSQKRSTN